MKITVYSRGTTDIDADTDWQEPHIREAIGCGCNDVASTITDLTDTERSNISHDEYVVVSEDDGTELWRGWLTGNPEDAPPADAVLAAVRRHIEVKAAKFSAEVLAVRAQDVKVSGGDILAIIDGRQSAGQQ